MKNLVLFCFFFLPLFLLAQSQADWVFRNGKVYTVNKAQPWAEAVAVKDSVIVFVGSDQDCRKWIGKSTREVDLKGRMLLPGFIDGHNHFLSGAYAKRGLKLVGVNERQGILDLLKLYVHDNPSKKFFMGYGWTFQAMGNKRITRHDLDSICNDKPVFLFNEDSHNVLFNTKAMETAGITKETKDPSENSFYEREADRTPSGLAIETESWMPMALALGISGGKSMLAEIMNEIFPELPKNGITAFHDMGIWAPLLSDGYKGFELMMEWEKEGRLPCRVAGVMGVRDAGLSPDECIAVLQEWNRKYHSDLVTVSGLKIWVDGTTETHTAVQLEPYLDKPETKGESEWTADLLAQWIGKAYAAGFDVHIHALGDGSVRRSLDAFETVGKKMDTHGRRSVVHHLSVIHPDDLSRFQTLGIGGNATLEWLSTYWDGIYRVFPKEKVDREYDIWNRLTRMGVNMTFGSDIPGTNPDEISPLYQMQTALTGEVPYMKSRYIRPADRVPTLEEMIKGYTLNGAYQMHLEDRTGSVETGKLADLIILNENIFDIQPDKLSHVRVVLTMMNGKVTYCIPAEKL